MLRGSGALGNRLPLDPTAPYLPNRGHALPKIYSVRRLRSKVWRLQGSYPVAPLKCPVRSQPLKPLIFIVYITLYFKAINLIKYQNRRYIINRIPFAFPSLLISLPYTYYLFNMIIYSFNPSMPLFSGHIILAINPIYLYLLFRYTTSFFSSLSFYIILSRFNYRKIW